MRHSLLIFAIGLTLSACGDQANNQKDTQTEAASATVVSAEQAVAGVPASESAEKSPSEQLNDWFEVNYETELMMSPISLTFLGRKERYDEIDDMSEEAEIKQLEWKRNSVAEMKERFDYEQLDANAKLSYDLWEYQYKLAEKGAKFRRSGYVFDQMRGSHSRFPTFIMGFHKVESLSDMQAYISRLSGLGRGMNQLVDRAKLGASEGVRPPRFAYEVVRQQALAVIDGVPFTESGENSPIWEDVSAKVGSLIEANTITQEQGDELLAAAKIALTEKFGPSYESLVAFLDADIENTSELSQGVHANPNGGEFYEYRLNAMTTTDMTADQIHQLGLSEVARLRTEMELLKEKSGFGGSLQEFFAYIRDSQDNEKFYFPNTDEGRKGYIDDATAAIDNIKKELPNYFGILPKGDLIVKRVESFREQDGAPQHYYPGTPTVHAQVFIMHIFLI